MKKIALAVLCMFALTGCVTTGTGVELVRNAPTHLMEKCHALPEAQSGQFADLFRNHVAVREAYEACAARHGDLVDWTVQGQAKKAP